MDAISIMPKKRLAVSSYRVEVVQASRRTSTPSRTPRSSSSISWKARPSTTLPSLAPSSCQRASTARWAPRSPRARRPSSIAPASSTRTASGPAGASSSGRAARGLAGAVPPRGSARAPTDSRRKSGPASRRVLPGQGRDRATAQQRRRCRRAAGATSGAALRPAAAAERRPRAVISSGSGRAVAAHHGPTSTIDRRRCAFPVTRRRPGGRQGSITAGDLSGGPRAGDLPSGGDGQRTGPGRPEAGPRPHGQSRRLPAGSALPPRDDWSRTVPRRARLLARQLPELGRGEARGSTCW